MSSPTTHSAVTVIGLGPMGQAMAATLLQAGHPVTVWNRTPSRADGVVAAGARWATTPADAVQAADLVILSLTDYRRCGTYSAASVPHWPAARSSTSARIRRTGPARQPTGQRPAARRSWPAGSPAPMVGTEASYVYYSGDRSSFDVHRDALARIGEPRFLGDDPGRAQLMYQANLDIFLTALAGTVHATALVETAGITAEVFLPEAMEHFAAIPEMMAPEDAAGLGALIDAGKHPGEGSTALMMGATADHIHTTADSVGIDTALPRAVQALYHRAIGDGYGTDGWTRIIDGIRAPRAGG